MSNLYAFVLFGREMQWTVSTTVLFLMLAQAALAAIALIVFAILMLRKYAGNKRKQNILVGETSPATKERELVGISVDASAVQRSFKVGDYFNYDGLIVTANYDSEPRTETITDFTVEEPVMSREGKPTVTVKYGGFTAFYTIDVSPVETARVPMGVELDLSGVRREFTVGERFDYGGLVVRMKYSAEPFTEEVFLYTVDIPSTDEAGEKAVAVHCGDFTEVYMIEVKEAAREPIGIELDLSVVKTDFFVGETFDSEGLGVIARYADEPTEERVTDFTVETPDLSREAIVDVVVRYGAFTQTYPIFVIEGRSLVGITLDTSVVRREFVVGEEFNCMGLIVTADYDSEPFNEQVEDYEVEEPDMSAEGMPEVKISYRGMSATYQVSVVSAEAGDDEEEVAIADEDGYERVLHIDRSFTARLIQADEDTQRFYSMIKNELLCYKKVHDRVSWKRETYKCAGNYVAKMNFRGNTLCLYLPLDPAEYADTRYKVEDASPNKSNEDTPCLFRIKNEKRARLAIDLIAKVMERSGIVRKEREPVDYSMPAQSTDELVEQGLIRREYRLRKKGNSFGKTE